MTDHKLTKAEAGRLGARRRWGPDPRVVRLDQLDPDTRRSILALLARAAGEPVAEKLSDPHRREMFVEYDADERWLVENDGFGASQIIARDVAEKDGRWLVARLAALTAESVR